VKPMMAEAAVFRGVKGVGPQLLTRHSPVARRCGTDPRGR
jgi:hypothetical protein